MEGGKRILAIETSGRHGSVAALWGAADESRLVGQLELRHDQRTAQTLVPAMDELLKQAAWAPDAIDLVAVAVGPGSFTGLRIGVTAAKTFAYAVGADVIGVNTLEVIAAQAPVSAAPLWTVTDAQRQELFAGKFVVGDSDKLQTERETTIVPWVKWLTALQPGDRVTGPALSRLVVQLPPGVELVREEFWQPMAEAVGRIAWQSYQAGRRDDVWKLVPQYYRSSAAEEKAARSN
jgi:tRNA threonylcarbamoyladenosine biosynthesis protein TsaB